MVTNPPVGMQRIIPYLTYADAPAAIDFLREAFGFTERMRVPGPDGTIGHAELAYRDNVVMLATAVAGLGLASPLALPARHGLVVCYVDDVDAHYGRARSAGATVLGEPEDQAYGDRTYRAVDPEGHHWFFHTQVRDVAHGDAGS